jgi:parallel beta-helix repeat protein
MRKERRVFLHLIFLLATASIAFGGRTIYVDDDGPADFSTIQAAIDDANNGDTVVVADGRYTGQGNRDIDFLGKAITVRSENGPERCIVDCNGSEGDPHRGFIFKSGEDPNSVVAGFTIMNACSPVGAAIICDLSGSPTISGCVIKGNRTWYDDGGAGIWSVGPRSGSVCSPIIRNCVITENIGAGICLVGDGSPMGGTCERYRSYPVVANCTITNNSGSGIIALYSCEVTIDNCIIRGNTRKGTALDIRIPWSADMCLARIRVSHSNVDPNRVKSPMPLDAFLHWGEGNVNVDPCFVDPNGGDYHLKSQAGRWDANEGRWTKDEVTSLCIDAGNPMTPIGHEPFPNGGIINMGAYGGTAEASKSYFGKPVCETIVAGDINGDCKVDFWDFAIMSLHWLEEN